eukprot:4491381-Alexandrium_andersonii.AAC.1
MPTSTRASSMASSRGATASRPTLGPPATRAQCGLLRVRPEIPASARHGNQPQQTQTIFRLVAALLSRGV